MATLKSNPQIFTPEYIVKKMLDIAGYTHGRIIGHPLLENSFGNGAFLAEVIKRYIDESIFLGHSSDLIVSNLERDIYGVEKDGKLFNECISKLDAIVQGYALKKVNWNFYLGDALTFSSIVKFHYIIGNPPYVTYSALEKKDRMYIRETFSSCKNGKADYYYAFIEHSFTQLVDGGHLLYLIPTNMFKTQFGQKLRDIILEDVVEIYDYKSISLFHEVLTSSAILHVKKNSHNSVLGYHDMRKENSDKVTIEKCYLQDKWIFTTNQYDKNASLGFSDFFNAFNSIATLHNESFLIRCESTKESDKYLNYGENLESCIEKQLLKRAISPRTAKSNFTEHIIFPYYFDNGLLYHYEENEFKKKFPKGYGYLLNRIENLEKRKSDLNAKWYEYGRSQAIARINQPKLMLSTVVSGNVKVYPLGIEEIPYSGIVITQKGKYPLDVAKRLLMSDLFLKYVNAIGINVSGHSIRISSRDINNFRFPQETLDEALEE